MDENEKLLNGFANACYLESEENGSSLETDRWRNEILALMEHKPARWIDGAVQVPKVGDEIVFKYLQDECNENSMTVEWITVIKPEEFKPYEWMLKADFPMPLPPKVVIENCPFCGGRCHTEELGENNNGEDVCCVTCDDEDCRYYSAQNRSEQEAIKEHNDLCRRLK